MGAFDGHYSFIACAHWGQFTAGWQQPEGSAKTNLAIHIHNVVREQPTYVSWHMYQWSAVIFHTRLKVCTCTKNNC